jgi:hypothetical protein
MTTYGYSIEWTTWNGRQRVTVTECSTPQEAYRETLDLAIRSGWTPPRWWQFWRWSDQRVVEPEEEV